MSLIHYYPSHFLSRLIPIFAKIIKFKLPKKLAKLIWKVFKNSCAEFSNLTVRKQIFLPHLELEKKMSKFKRMKDRITVLINRPRNIQSLPHPRHLTQINRTSITIIIKKYIFHILRHYFQMLYGNETISKIIYYI